MPPNLTDTDRRFIEFFKAERKRLGYSQSELGKLVYGESKNPGRNISRIESGSSSLQLSTIHKFLEIFGAEIDFIKK